VKALLDANTLLWSALDPGRLSPAAQRVVRPTENDLVLSAVSCIELAIKWRAGKLGPLTETLDEFIAQQIRDLRLDELPVTREHGLQVARLELHHRDPFDRLLVAQAQVERLAIVTNDPLIARYGVETIW